MSGDSMHPDSVHPDSVRHHGTGLRRQAHLGRPRGIYVALALLTLGAVFAATAGVREALASRTQALRATLAATLPLSRTITVATTWDSVSSALESQRLTGPAQPDLSQAQITEISGQLHGDYNHGIISLAPDRTDWASMASRLNNALHPLPGTDAVPVKLEVSYRQPLGRHVRLLAGHLPAPPVPATPPQPGPAEGPVHVRSAAGPAGPSFYPLLQVVVTEREATRFGLRVGSKVAVSGPQVAFTGRVTPITLQVSGIVAPASPASSFWTADATVVTPTLEGPPTSPFWVGGVIAGPGEAAAVQQDFGPAGMAIQWVLPIAVGSLTGQQARPLASALTAISAQAPPLSGDVASVSGILTPSSNLQTALGEFLTTAQSVDTLLWLLYVSLTVTGLTVLLLAGRMIAMRRSAELTVLRARGASLSQIAIATGRDAALACVPAAAAAVGLAFLAVPGGGRAPGAWSWWPPAAVLAVASCGPALIAAWQHRLPRRRAAAGRHPPRGRVRLVTEVALVAAAVAGIVVFRQQATAGTPASAGVNLYTSATPVLVAVPAVIVVLRVYPLVLRGLLRACARGSRAPAFLGLASAARTALTPALPAFALVLGLTVAAFAGMVRNAVTNGDVAASWRAVGADATITAAPASKPDFTIPANAARAIGRVPGVTHAAEVWTQTWLALDGTQVTVLAVNPASYAALVTAVHGYPPVPARLLAPPSAPDSPQPVLASPAAAASLGKSAVTLSTQGPARPIRVRVAGVLSGTPGMPAGGAFIIVPFAALRSPSTPPTPIPVTEMLLTGSGIDRARLAAVMRHLIPNGMTTFRSDVLAGLTGAPLQHGAFVLLALALAVAAALGLAVMLLELALSAAEREATLARLATMGLGAGQRAGVVALEVLPAVIAAAAAAWACALVLPPIVAPAIDLSVFTASSARVPLALDVASVALPLAGLAVLAALALGIEIRAGRRRGVTSALRVGG